MAMTPEEKIMFENAIKAVEDVRSTLERKAAEKSMRVLMKEINEGFVGNLNDVSSDLRDTTELLKEMAEMIKKEKGQFNQTEFIKAIKEISINPQIKVDVPEIKVPEPKVNVPAPIVKIPDFPKEMEVKGIAGYFKTLVQAFTGKLNVGLEDVDRDNPLTVTLVDKNGAYYTAGGAVTVMGKGGKVINEIDNETPTGTIDGSNQEFTLSHSPIPSSSLKLFLNGMYQSPVGEDYTLHDNVIDFIVAPPSGSILRAFYKF